MASSKNVIDWDQLKPRIIQGLENGKTQQQIRRQLAEDPDDTYKVFISKSQLETQLKHWKYRRSLHQPEWKVIGHRINKRRKAGKSASQVLVNGFMFSEKQVAKAINRYVTPTFAYRLPSPEIPPELSHHLIEIRTPPPRHLSLHSHPSQGTVAKIDRNSLTPYLKLARRVWPQNTQWRRVELSVGQFVARFFIPTYEQDEEFREAFRSLRREFPVSQTCSGENAYSSYWGHERLLIHQAWEISSDSHGDILPHREEIMRPLGGSNIHTALVEILVRLLYDLCNESLADTGHNVLAWIMESPGWGTVLPHLRDGLAMLDSKIVQAIAEGLFKQSIRTNHQMMLDLSIGLGASPTQPIKYFDAYKGRHVLSTPLVAICKGYNERPESGHSPEKLIRSLLKADTHISNSRLLWIIRAGCHAIAEEEIRSRPGREINFAITVSDLEEGRWLSFDTYDPVTPLLVACSDPRHSAEKLSLIRCLLQHNAEADLEAMIAAAGAGDEEVILLLHQHGAPINGHIPGLGSPLSSACKAHLCPSYRHSRSVTAISLLLELGASPNSPDDGDLDSWELSPLHICALSREEESVEEALDLLIDYGADVNHRAKFHPIVYFRCAQVAVHASVNVKLAETALEYAIQSSHWTSAIQLLSANCELTGREILFVDISGYEVGRRAAPDEDFREFLDALLTKAPSQAATRHWNGLTLLQRAIEHEHEDMILALFTHGVTPTPSDFLCMLRNRMPERAEVSRLSSNTQMQLLLAARKYSADHSAFKLILAFACPEVVRNVLNSCPNVYDSEGLCYVIARITTKDQVSYYLAYWVSDEEEDQQADSLTIGDLQALVSRRNASNSNEDWESTAVTIAARAGRADILRILTRSCQDHTGGHGLIPSFLLKEVLMVDHKMVGPTSTDVDERNTGFVGIWIKYCGMDDPNMRCSPLTAAAMVVPETVAGEVIDLLLALGYRPDGWTVLVASRQGYLSILQRLRQLDSWPHILNHRDRPDWCPTALQTAVYSSHHSAVRFLLDEGTTMDAMDLCPCRPFYFTPPEIVRPAAPNTILPRTSLQHAVGNEDMELVTLLVNAGANVNAPAAKDSGATALQIASIQGSIPMVQYLISQGADPHATGAAIHGRTALEGAAEHGRKDVVELLLGHGESTAYQRHEQLAKALLRAEKSAQCVVSAILREQLLLQRCSEDEKTLDMLEEDWESSSERSGHFEMRTDIEAWGETCDDWQNSLRLYERNSSSYMRQEEPHENPVAPQEEGSCFVPGMDWGREGHGRPDLHQNSEIDIYGGDIVLDLALQDDTPSWVDVQRGLERYDGVDMLLDDVL